MVIIVICVAYNIVSVIKVYNVYDKLIIKRNKHLCRKCKAFRFGFSGGVPRIYCDMDDSDSGYSCSKLPSDFYRSEVPCHCVFKLEHDVFPINLRDNCERNLFICKQVKCSRLLERISANSIIEYQCSLCDRNKFHNSEQFNARQCASKCRYQMEHYAYYIKERQNDYEQKMATSI